MYLFVWLFPSFFGLFGGGGRWALGVDELAQVFLKDRDRWALLIGMALLHSHVLKVRGKFSRPLALWTATDCTKSLCPFKVCHI